MSESHESSDRDLPSVQLVDVNKLAAEQNQQGSCLRPLGLCELSGSCDVCWYRPDHPRFQKE